MQLVGPFDADHWSVELPPEVMTEGAIERETTGFGVVGAGLGDGVGFDAGLLESLPEFGVVASGGFVLSGAVVSLLGAGGSAV